MEVSFLKNNHHNLFENKPLQFNKFICKDCTQKKLEYEHDSTDNIPKNILNKIQHDYREIVSMLY